MCLTTPVVMAGGGAVMLVKMILQFIDLGVCQVVMRSNAQSSSHMASPTKPPMLQKWLETISHRGGFLATSTLEVRLDRA